MREINITVDDVEYEILNGMIKRLNTDWETAVVLGITELFYQKIVKPKL